MWPRKYFVMRDKGDRQRFVWGKVKEVERAGAYTKYTKLIGFCFGFYFASKKTHKVTRSVAKIWKLEREKEKTMSS